MNTIRNVALTSLTLLVCGPASASPDYQCMSDCSSRYSWAYCQQVCEIREPSPQSQRRSIFDSFIEGQRARQEHDARAAEIERMESEAARLEAETERIRQETLRAQREADERERMKAENEALKKRLEELEKAKEEDATPEEE